MINLWSNRPYAKRKDSTCRQTSWGVFFEAFSLLWSFWVRAASWALISSSEAEVTSQAWEVFFLLFFWWVRCSAALSVGCGMQEDFRRGPMNVKVKSQSWSQDRNARSCEPDSRLEKNIIYYKRFTIKHRFAKLNYWPTCSDPWPNGPFLCLCAVPVMPALQHNLDWNEWSSKKERRCHCLMATPPPSLAPTKPVPPLWRSQPGWLCTK